MIARRPQIDRLAAALGLFVGLSLAEVPAQAQHTPDPYNIVGEYNNQYEPYMYATYPSASGTLPNQARLDGRSGIRNANSFQSAMDFDSDDDDYFGRGPGSRMAGPGTPYYRAYRRFDPEFDRNYRPNKEADKSYYSDQERRNTKYFEAVREKDPRKRAQLLREYNLENLRSARTLSAGRNEQGREGQRDRFAPPDSEIDDERDLDATQRRAPATPGLPTAVARPAPPATRKAAPAPGATRTAAPASATSRTTRPAPSSGTTTTRSNRSVSDILERSELLDRAARSTAPVVPKPVREPLIP